MDINAIYHMFDIGIQFITVPERLGGVQIQQENI